MPCIAYQVLSGEIFWATIKHRDFKIVNFMYRDFIIADIAYQILKITDIVKGYTLDIVYRK